MPEKEIENITARNPFNLWACPLPPIDNQIKAQRVTEKPRKKEPSKYPRLNFKAIYNLPELSEEELDQKRTINMLQPILRINRNSLTRIIQRSSIKGQPGKTEKNKTFTVYRVGDVATKIEEQNARIKASQQLIRQSESLLIDDPIISLTDASKKYHIPAITLHSWCREDKPGYKGLQATTIGRQKYVHESELLAAMVNYIPNKKKK